MCTSSAPGASNDCSGACSPMSSSAITRLPSRSPARRRSSPISSAWRRVTRPAYGRKLGATGPRLLEMNVARRALHRRRFSFSARPTWEVVAAGDAALGRGLGALHSRRLVREPRRLTGAVTRMAAELRRNGIQGIKDRRVGKGLADGQADYAEWVKEFDTLHEADCAAIACRVRELAAS